MQHTKNTINRPQVKVCGLTRVEDAIGCAELGVDAIGCVFYPESPRHVTPKQAGEICKAVSEKVKTVGVFVNASFTEIMETVTICSLNAVQLHGQESSTIINQLLGKSLIIVKTLFDNGTPSLEAVVDYNASAYIVECGKGQLPGGNALTWDWEKAKSIGKQNPLILAGGLTPENIKEAIALSSPDAVDVSSGVESGPGLKDLDKVKFFMHAVSQCIIKGDKQLKKIY